VLAKHQPEDFLLRIGRAFIRDREQQHAAALHGLANDLLTQRRMRFAAILRNVTDQACTFPLEIPLVFSMTVKDQNGRDVPRTRAFQDALKAGPEKKFDYPVPAKQEFEGGHLISHFFSMETPGVYSVTFSKDVYQPGTVRIGKVTSNTIKVKVSNLVYPRTTSDCFTLFARSEKETVKVGEPIRVIGILQNIVDEPCAVPWASGKEGYSITVKNKFGADVAEIERKESPYNSGGSSSVHIIPAKQAKEEILDWGAFFES
jgi:hypothetical protein